MSQSYIHHGNVDRLGAVGDEGALHGDDGAVVDSVHVESPGVGIKTYKGVFRRHSGLAKLQVEEEDLQSLSLTRSLSCSQYPQ